MRELMKQIDRLGDEAKAAIYKSNAAFTQIHADDMVYSKFWDQIMEARCVCERIRDDALADLRRSVVQQKLELLLDATIKWRNTAVACAQYVEAVAAQPELSFPGAAEPLIEEFGSFAAAAEYFKGFRRWSP